MLKVTLTSRNFCGAIASETEDYLGRGVSNRDPSSSLGRLSKGILAGVKGNFTKILGPGEQLQRGVLRQVTKI